MYATIRQYDIAGETAELNRLVQEEFVPLMQSLPGFISYQWIDVGDVGGRMLSVSIFDTAEHAEESNRTAAAAIKDIKRMDLVLFSQNQKRMPTT